jgi:hypothetical protein
MTETKPQITRKTGFLEDDQGNPSSMRLMGAIALIASIVFGLLTTLHPVANKGTNGLYITMAFLLGAFAPKALQKFAEVKFPPKGLTERIAAVRG